jgi:hypothetical protein
MLDVFIYLYRPKKLFMNFILKLVGQVLSLCRHPDKPSLLGTRRRPPSPTGVRFEENFPDQISKLPANFFQTGAALGGDLIIFAHPAPEHLQARSQKVRFLQMMQKRIEAAGADGVALLPEEFAQAAAINRGLRRLVQDHQANHTLPKGLGNLVMIIHKSIIDIYRLGNVEAAVDFSLVFH